MEQFIRVVLAVALLAFGMCLIVFNKWFALHTYKNARMPNIWSVPGLVGGKDEKHTPTQQKWFIINNRAGCIFIGLMMIIFAYILVR